MIQASDKDIIDALHSVRAMPWLSANGEVWALLDETLLLDALEHILLTSIEHKLQLDKLSMAELLEVLQAEENPLSCALPPFFLECIVLKCTMTLRPGHPEYREPLKRISALSTIPSFRNIW